MYPSVRAVLPIQVPGQPLEMILATRFDGLVQLVGAKESGHALPGQMGAESIARIENSAEGILLIDRFSECRPVRFADGAWSHVALAPPRWTNANAHDQFANPERESWYESRVLVDRTGSITTVCASDPHRGALTTARWRNGHAEVLGRETSDLKPASCFLTPDGAIWNADRGNLNRFTGDRWAKAGDFDWPRAASRYSWSNIGRGLHTVNDTGPPWILHDQLNELLIRLTYGPDFKDPRIEIVSLTDSDRSERLKVRDAIAWNNGELLLATDRGLRTLAIDGGNVTVPLLNSGGRMVSKLVRDGRGRLWLGGEGLAVLDADGRTLHALDDLPILGRQSKVEALAADAAKADGAIAAIEGRGVVFVSLDGRSTVP